jgi:hypothetical protein
MGQSPDAAAGAALPTSPTRARSRWWLRVAPHPDLPHPRDRAGAQRGLLLAILAAGLFWLALGFGLFAAWTHG